MMEKWVEFSLSNESENVVRASVVEVHALFALTLPDDVPFLRGWVYGQNEPEKLWRATRPGRGALQETHRFRSLESAKEFVELNFI